MKHIMLIYAHFSVFRTKHHPTAKEGNLVVAEIFHPIFVVFCAKMAEEGKVSRVLKYTLFAFNLLYWVSGENIAADVL